MKLYIVIEHTYHDSIESIWTTKRQAEERVQYLNSNPTQPWELHQPSLSIQEHQIDG